jgi:hypothetical protein
MPGSCCDGWRIPGRIIGHPATVRDDRFCFYPRCGEYGERPTHAARGRAVRHGVREAVGPAVRRWPDAREGPWNRWAVHCDRRVPVGTGSVRTLRYLRLAAS